MAKTFTPFVPVNTYGYPMTPPSAAAAFQPLKVMPKNDGFKLSPPKEDLPPVHVKGMYSRDQLGASGHAPKPDTLINQMLKGYDWKNVDDRRKANLELKAYEDYTKLTEQLYKDRVNISEMQKKETERLELQAKRQQQQNALNRIGLTESEDMSESVKNSVVTSEKMQNYLVNRAQETEAKRENLEKGLLSMVPPAVVSSMVASMSEESNMIGVSPQQQLSLLSTGIASGNARASRAFPFLNAEPSEAQRKQMVARHAATAGLELLQKKKAERIAKAMELKDIERKKEAFNAIKSNVEINRDLRRGLAEGLINTRPDIRDEAIRALKIDTYGRPPGSPTSRSENPVIKKIYSLIEGENGQEIKVQKMEGVKEGDEIRKFTKAEKLQEILKEAPKTEAGVKFIKDVMGPGVSTAIGRRKKDLANASAAVRGNFSYSSQTSGGKKSHKK